MVSSACTGYRETEKNSIYCTNRENVPVYARPLKDADPVDTITAEHTIVTVTDYTINNRGNKWYRLSDGRFIYSGNLGSYRNYLWNRRKSGKRQ